MVSTTFEKFSSLAETGVIVPVYAEILADMETPVSVLNRFAGDENVFLLESVEGGERVGRFSFLGINPRGVFTVADGQASYTSQGVTRKLEHREYPLDALRQLISGKRVAGDPQLPPLPGGAVGYLGYEAAGMFEKLPPPASAPETPDACFMLTDEIIAFDNLRHTIKVIVSVHTDEFPSLRAAYDYGVSEVEKTAAVLAAGAPHPVNRGGRGDIARGAVSVPGHDQFVEMVEKAREHIRCGDIIQAVLSRRFTVPCELPPLDIYRALRLINPSPYNFFLKLGDTTLAGSSPETLVKLTGENAAVRPIAGTRPRGRTDADDRRLADELLRDEKERAEHLMLVDLARNDLGRTALPGSVQVRSFMNVERYSHVMHLVSDVGSVMRKDADALELLRTTFPAGTLSGAPKIRAMEIISELEHAPRGIYGGAVGYLSYDGNMDMAITIRTIEQRNGKLFIQAGAGIVADSDPEREYEETANKAAALFRAIEMAGSGLVIG